MLVVRVSLFVTLTGFPSVGFGAHPYGTSSAAVFGVSPVVGLVELKTTLFF